MATLSASRRNSSNSNPSTPRPSLSGNSVPKMSSLNEEASATAANDTNGTCEITNGFAKIDLDVTSDEKTDADIAKGEESATDQIEETSREYLPKNMQKLHNGNAKSVRARACSERSDSGISDCSSHITSSSCTSTPLLGKKFCINEEVEDNNNDKRFSSSATLVLSNRLNKNNERNCSISPFDSCNNDDKKIIQEDKKSLSNGDDENKHSGLSLKLSNKIETFNGSTPVKCEYVFLTSFFFGVCSLKLLF